MQYFMGKEVRSPDARQRTTEAAAAMTQITALAIEASARALIEARSTALGIEIDTPVVYPNGDLVTSVVVQEGERFTVHDAGLA